MTCRFDPPVASASARGISEKTAGARSRMIVYGPTANSSQHIHVGCCQNHGPFLGP